MQLIESQFDLTNLGIAIRAKRIDLGWTQEQLAQQAGVSQGALSMFEQSGTGMKMDRLAAILRVVGLVLVVDERSNYVEESS